MGSTYDFISATRADRPMLHGWLAQVHVMRWWGDPDTELALIEEEFDRDVVDMRVVSLDGLAFAFVQDYPAHHWDLPQFAAFPEGTRAVDTFIGAPEMIGKGHGWRFVRQRVAALRRNFPAVVIDPEPDNIPAIGAYRKAGFKDVKTTPCEDGSPVLVMEFKG